MPILSQSPSRAAVLAPPNTANPAPLIDTCQRQIEEGIALETAIDRLRAASQPRPTVRLPLIRALNHVLAVPLLAPNPFPPFDRAMMDGYAARFHDLSRPAPLVITGESVAGRAHPVPLMASSVVAIATGAPLPQGADCVIRKEYARVEGNQIFVTAELLRVGADCEQAGSIALTGDLLIAANTRLQPNHLAIAARHGLRELTVRQAPRIQILLTGNELLAAGQAPQSGCIYEHNHILIASFLAQQHHTVLPGGDIIPDDETTLRRRVEAALNAVMPPDFILLVGGTSVGAHDHTRRALNPLGTWLFKSLNTRPGRPACALKTTQGIPVIALPGSPKAVEALLLNLIAPTLNL
jgi:molybdopterin molybdotransferase